MADWIDAPGLTRNLAEKCADDAADLGGRIHEKRQLLRILREHGRGGCLTAKKLRAEISGLRAQQKQLNDSAARLIGGPVVFSKPNRGRAARSMPPERW